MSGYNIYNPLEELATSAKKTTEYILKNAINNSITGGLMKTCTKCCQTDKRPKIVFNKEGVCGACQWEEEKKTIDWNKRLQFLEEIAMRAKKQAKKRGTYDAVLGVSGGKDSMFTAMYAKDVLGLNCLLVSAYPDQITDIGEQNFQNLVSKGFDCIRIYTDPQLVKRLMKRDFERYLHFRKANEYPLWASTYTVAKEKNIPLVIQGENAALTLGVSEDMNTDWDASTIYKTNTIGGETAFEHFDEVFTNKLLTFKFPDLTDWDGKAIWLNYFVKNYSPSNNAKFSIKQGLKIREDSLENLGRIEKHTCLDSNFHIVSQFHKYRKHGFGFAMDEVCNAIRAGEMTREEGFEALKKYDGKCADRYIQEFCDFINITREYHDQIVEKFTNKDLFEKIDGVWKLKGC